MPPPPAAPDWSAPSSPPPAQAPTGWGGGAAPPPPEPSGISGCMKLLIVVLVLAVVAVIVFVALAGALFSNVASNLGAAGGADDNCVFLSDEDARTVFGGNADAIELAGLYDASIGLIIDKRALANAPDCWVTEGAKAYIAQIAVYQGGDAASVFATERADQPTSEDQGDGVTIENPGYLGADVSGLGDEAFCTDISPAIMAGVLVRQGDRVVYVSVGSANEDQPTLDPAELCLFAQDVARFMLR